MIEALKGRRILVVEDESLVAMLLETILEDMGCETVGPVSNVAEAVGLVDGGEPLHGALLDVNVAGVEVFPVAAALEARGLPFVFSTGYGEGGLPDEWKGRITLQKPFTEAAVEEALARALSQA
ncbi:MAG: response regulator [Brevundimonas sp.]|uniref:response regulator n=1 Tax=Brevundimonas sp. TaxID=1871086 RepID=UPI0040344953